MIKSKFLFIALFFIANLSWGGIQDSIGVSKINNEINVKYLVEPGETIYGISTKYGIPVSDLLEINPELENGLKVGQIINIPYRPELRKKEPNNNALYHEVQAGETLYSLAKRYNTSVNELMRLNNMSLQAGQKIIVGYKDQPLNPKETPSTPPTKEVQKALTTAKKTEDSLKKANKVVTPKTENTIKENKTEVAQIKETPINTEEPIGDMELYNFNPKRKQILIIPFDPYLYFSDADQEIAAKSNVSMPKVRQIFRRRLNAMLYDDYYETIHLLGGKSKDSTADLNKIYQSVTYGYQEALYNKDNPNTPGLIAQDHPKEEKPAAVEWLNKQKKKIKNTDQTGNMTGYDIPEDLGKYFGVKIKDPDLFKYFGTKYSIDYYVFINQFEVKTNYENCLDRAALNYERTFTTHFSIFDKDGKQIAGNKFKTKYQSNSNYIWTIVSDNVPAIAERILKELPPLGN